MSPYQCAHCKKTLSFIEHARSPHCEEPICQLAKVQLYLAENKQRLTAQVIAELEKFIKHTPARKLPSRLRKELKNTSPLIALLPANTNQLTELGQKRKLEFLRHVSMIYKDVKTHNPSANRVYSEQLEPPLPKDEAQLLGNACATCMGYCCRLGQTHAFVDYPTLKNLLASQPAEFSEKDLLDLYSDYFPKQSYQNSCVFQGNNGCTLPRDVRSITCNNFLCDEVKKYRREVLQTDSELTFAVAVDKKTIMFTSAYSHENFIRVKEKKA
jgi:Fe-S-cluster containining protein